MLETERRQAVSAAGCLTYTLLADRRDDQTAWGVRVELYTPDGRREIGEVRDITSVASRAAALLALLARGTVTPVSLQEVLEDWLAE